MAERFHILLVSEPGLDGVFRHVEGLADYLLARGHRVDLAYSSVRAGAALAPLVKRIGAAKGAVLDLCVGNEVGPADVLALYRLHHFVARTRPQVIHAHSSKAGGLVRLLPRFPSQRIFYTPHAYFGLRPGKHWRGRFYNRVEQLLGRRGTTINVSGSEAGFAEVVLGIPTARRRLIWNGVDTRRFVPATPEQRRAARLRLKIPPEALVLGTVARLSLQKDPQTLYRAFAAAHAQERSLHLLHLGTGPNPRYAQDLILPELKPHVTRVEVLEDTLPIYHAADGFVMTSRYEGMPLVVLEALACGLPLVLSNAAGHDDILRLPLSATEVFSSGDPVDGAAAMTAWCRNHESARTNNHRLLACRHFDAQTSYGRIFDAYTIWGDYRSAMRRRRVYPATSHHG